MGGPKFIVQLPPTTVRITCGHCGTVFIVRTVVYSGTLEAYIYWEQDEQEEEPTFCPYCGTRIEDTA